ncbi:hypothetical protein QE400_000124 [Xanthomonas sacchari]|nr:hypothetical protein [Xanthomonas sacchari]
MAEQLVDELVLGPFLTLSAATGVSRVPPRLRSTVLTVLKLSRAPQAGRRRRYANVPISLARHDYAGALPRGRTRRRRPGAAAGAGDRRRHRGNPAHVVRQVVVLLLGSAAAERCDRARITRPAAGLPPATTAATWADSGRVRRAATSCRSLAAACGAPARLSGPECGCHASALYRPGRATSGRDRPSRRRRGLLACLRSRSAAGQARATAAALRVFVGARPSAAALTGTPLRAMHVAPSVVPTLRACRHCQPLRGAVADAGDIDRRG